MVMTNSWITNIGFVKKYIIEKNVYHGGCKLDHWGEWKGEW
jgi:hypothetical protein